MAADLGDCEYFGIPEPMPLCPRGDPDGDRSMVLLGDSHMRHWIPALERIAKRNGYRSYYFVLQGCTPALVLPYSPFYEAPDTDCVFFHEWTQEQIEGLRPDLVVMSTDTQARYVDRRAAPTSTTTRRSPSDDRGGHGRSGSTSLEPLTDAVVVLGDVPRLEFDPSVISDRGATLADGLSDPMPSLHADAAGGEERHQGDRRRLHRDQAVVLRLREVCGGGRRLHHPPRPRPHHHRVLHLPRPAPLGRRLQLP